LIEFLRERKLIFYIDLARSNPLKPVVGDEKLLKAFAVLCARDCHRVPVLDGNGNIKKLTTQYSVIEYLYKNKDKYAHALAHTVCFSFV
jgi:CBS-domain-containing membrane protein